MSPADSSVSNRRRLSDGDLDALHQGARKKPFVSSLSCRLYSLNSLTIHFNSKRSDPLVHAGRHFGRIIFGFCNVHVLIVNGLAWLADDPDLMSLTMKDVIVAWRRGFLIMY